MREIEKLEEMINKKDELSKNELLNQLSNIHRQMLYLQEDMDVIKDNERGIKEEYRRIKEENTKLKRIIDVCLNISDNVYEDYD